MTERAAGPLQTPDGRYIVVRGRLWRRSDPRLSDAQRQALVDDLMRARSAVGRAKREGEVDALAAARRSVNEANRDLGERGPVW